jgi:hypothetical protein
MFGAHHRPPTADAHPVDAATLCRDAATGAGSGRMHRARVAPVRRAQARIGSAKGIVSHSAMPA